MNDLRIKLFPDSRNKNELAKTGLSIAIVVNLLLLMLFPSPAGWLSGILTILGFFWLVRHRDTDSMDLHFAAVCLILPLSYLYNMLVMGWEPGLLDRPSRLIWALMIYFLIGRYGVHRNTLFYSACVAALTAFAIAVFEVFYLGHSRAFGLGGRWNAVPFGNFSLLFGFFCLCGAFVTDSGHSKVSFRSLFAIAGFASGFTACVLSGSRGGWLAIPFLIILCFFFNDRLTVRARLITLMFVTAALITVFSSSDRIHDRIVLAKNQVSAYIAHPENLAAQNTSTGMRLAMWHWGLQKFQEHPFTGIGLAAYKDQRKEAVIEGDLPVAFAGLANLHNEFITALALGGIPGGLALIGFWILGWRFFYRRLKSADDDQHYFALCGLVAISGTALFSMTEGLFGTSAGTKALMLSLAIPAGCLRYLARQRKFSE